MAVKDVLLALTTYPDPTPVSAVEEAIAFASAVGAQISAIACAVEIRAPGSFLADMVMDIQAMAAAESRKSATNAESLLTAFRDTAEKQGVFQDRILARCLKPEVPELLVEYARLRDLTIVPLPEGDSVEHWCAEAIIFGSGRPTLIIPQPRKRADTFALDTVLIAWDFSRPASRAVADALPILQKAKRVTVITITNDKVIDTSRSGAELAKHLARHDVQVVLETVDAEGRAVGDVLRSCVASRNADLLVMGAYGHSRVRDFILGGATRSMIAQPPLPILLSH